MVDNRESNYPRAAYKVEGQAIAVVGLQRQGHLMPVGLTYIGRETSIEEGLKWYILRCEIKLELEEICLLALDCDESLLRRLRKGQPLIEIYDPTSRPDINFGRSDSLTAAVLDSKNRPLYKSPGFNLDLYLGRPESPSSPF